MIFEQKKLWQKQPVTVQNISHVTELKQFDWSNTESPYRFPWQKQPMTVQNISHVTELKQFDWSNTESPHRFPWRKTTNDSPEYQSRDRI